MKEFTHFDKYGNAVMVDVSHKKETTRVAKASGVVKLNETTFQALKSNRVGKGDVLGVARIAGIMSAKNTASIIPLCHPLSLSEVKIDFKLVDTSVCIHAVVKTNGPTGVEMEALTAVSTAALTIYDMCKAIDKSISIEKIHLLHKSGGKSGVFNYEG